MAAPPPATPSAESYARHVEIVTAAATAALERCGGFDGVLFHAGSASCYHADDIEVPFRSVAHFTRFAPLVGPDHLLAFRPGAPLRAVRVVPRDYWTALPEDPDHPLLDVLDVSQASDLASAARALGPFAGFAYVGNAPEAASSLGFGPEAIEPPRLIAALDWARGFKTGYELACLRGAAQRAAPGHAAARAAACEGRSERDIHAAYLSASGQLDGETPYPNIIAWDEASAVLHYDRRRASAPDPAATFLIDAGASCHGYASDVTRTYALSAAHPVFREAVVRMDAVQRRLVAQVSPGASYVALHAQAQRAVCELLVELGIVRVAADEAFERGLGLPFLPHGLGHHLGLQVHDVGGRQLGPDGEQGDPPPNYPALRTTRDLAPGHVVTIEPGLYFISMLLEPRRASRDRDAYDWSLIDQLVPCGGIRIEDDVAVTVDGHEDLTRPWIPGAAPDGSPSQGVHGC